MKEFISELNLIKKLEFMTDILRFWRDKPFEEKQQIKKGLQYQSCYLRFH